MMRFKKEGSRQDLLDLMYELVMAKEILQEIKKHKYRKRPAYWRDKQFYERRLEALKQAIIDFKVVE